jgi:putative DNA primase/helicase
MPEEKIKTEEIKTEKKKVRAVKDSIPTNKIASDFCDCPTFEKNLVYFIDYDAFFIFTDGRYFKKLKERDFKKIILRFCETNYPRRGFSDANISDVISLVKLKINREAQKEDTQYIAFNDCLYNTRTNQTEEFSTDKLVTWNIPYNIANLNDPIPVFTKFIESSIVEKDNHYMPDYELIHLVQEMMGYIMLDSLYATGAFFLYGQGSNGKGVFTRLIADIFGSDYCSALSLSNFSDKFSVKDIINKRVNISSEEDEKFASGKMFKALVTGDPVRGEHKFGDGFTIESICKFIFATNKLPTFDGLDYGLKRRIFIIPFYRIFSPREKDHLLNEKLLKEIPGIIGWALEGAKRLIANNYSFSSSKSSANVFADFEEEMSSAIMFFNENYVIDNDFRTPRSDVYRQYVDWLRENGKKGVLSTRKFNKELMENISGLNNELFGMNKEGSFRAFNCRPSNRENRDIPVISIMKEKDLPPQLLF